MRWAMLVVCPTIGGSGTQVFHERLAAGLKPFAVETEMRLLSPRWEYFPWGMNLIPLERETAQQRRVHLIHTSSEYGCLFSRKAPLLVTLHHLSVDAEVLEYFSRPVRWHHRWLLRSFFEKTVQAAECLVASSHATRRGICEALGETLDLPVIHLGLDARRYSPSAEGGRPADGRIRLFYCGNPSRRKGFDLLDPLMKMLGGDYMLEYTTGLRHSEVRLRAGNARHLGVLREEELIAAINRADIILQPTRREGFGFAVLEGMACAKPVVSTACSSIPEILEHEKGGILCEPGSLSQLAEAIKKLAHSAEMRHSMGNCNRQRVLDLFTQEKMAARYFEVYQRLGLK